jgi:integrase
MAKPYKESGVWSFRLRIRGEDNYRTGFATEALARGESDKLRHALKNTGKPAHKGPWKTSLGEALTDYGREHLPRLKGGEQEAVRINRYLRLAGLPILKLFSVEDEAQITEKSVVYWRVELAVARGPRKIPQGLSAHRQEQAQTTQRSDALRKRLAGGPVADIGSHDIQTLIDNAVTEGKGASTIRLEHALLRHFFNYALHTWKWPLVGGNPALNRELPDLDNARDRVLNNREWKLIGLALEQTRNPYVSNALALLLESAMRCSEALVRVRWQDFNEETCLLMLRKTKAGWRKVPLNPGAMDVMHLLREHAVSFGPVSPAMPVFRLTYEALRAAWTRVCERAGVEGVQLHDLRHTSATRFALELHGNMPVLKIITGHKTDSQLMRYINIKPEAVSRLMHGRPLNHDDAPAGLHVIRAEVVRPLPGAPSLQPQDLPANVVAFVRRGAGP